MKSSHVLAIGSFLLLEGCLTLKAYEGPRLPLAEVARVQGDYKMRAGAPVSLLLRQVDGLTVDVRFSEVDLLPGRHSLLVDCVVAEGAGGRHRLEVDLAAGRRYVIVAETGPGNRECTDVRLIGASP
ncbi:MAG: hypothetical protein ABL964_09570 [Steroidobacteraceae bacterium]